MLARCTALPCSTHLPRASLTAPSFAAPKSTSISSTPIARVNTNVSSTLISWKATRTTLPFFRFSSAAAQTESAKSESTAEATEATEAKATKTTKAPKTAKKEKTQQPIEPIAHPAASPIKHPNTLQEPAFAVVHFNGKQYKVTPGDVLISTRVIGAPVGSNILLNKVLLIGTKGWTALGTPLLEDAQVSVAIEEQTMSRKVLVFKKKRRKNYKRMKGHRQPITTVRILDIIFDVAKFRSSVLQAETKPVPNADQAEPFTVRASGTEAPLTASPAKGTFTTIPTAQ